MRVPDVSVLIVTYNSEAFIDRCLASLHENAGCDYEVVVADNDSSDGTVARLRRDWPDVELVCTGGNLGFSRGNNAAFLRSHGRYVLLLNGDAWLLPGALPRLVEFLDEHPEAGVVSPRLLNPDGSDQRTARAFPTPAAAVFGRRSTLTRAWPGNPWSRRYLDAAISDLAAAPAGGQRVDWVSGACLMTRRSTYLALGGLDEGFFMHWEDADYCRRVSDAGMRVYCVEDAAAMHAEGGSRGGWPVAQIRHFHHGAYRYYAKHHLSHGPARVGRPIAAAVLGLRASALAAAQLLPRAAAHRREQPTRVTVGPKA